MDLYAALGGAAGCRALSTAFYAQVALDPILRPLFPSTFRCAIEEFSAFLVQFLGGETEATQDRWWLSLQQSHRRFRLTWRERDAWLAAMQTALEGLELDAGVRRDLLAFFTHASAYLVNEGPAPAVRPIKGELADLWNEQRALDAALEFTQAPEDPALQARFARSPSVHASFLAKAAARRARRQYAFEQLRAHPALVSEHYSHGRTLLVDAAATGDLPLVELLLDLGAGGSAGDQHVVYRLANECLDAAAAIPILHLLLRRTKVDINAAIGSKRCTALHMAARRGNAGLIAALLDHGAHLDTPDSMGDTPLRRAVNCGHLESARVLLERGANPHTRGSKRLTPLLAARTNAMKQVFAPPAKGPR